jgi:HlyD family secretion protein
MDRRIAKPKWRNRRLVWLAGALALIALAAVLIPQIPPPGSLTVKAADLEIGTAGRAPFQDYLPVRGEVAPLHTVFVTAVSGGQVDKVIVQDGAQVVAGAALAMLSNPSLKLDVTSKEATIADQLGGVTGQELTLERNRLDRQKEIAETSFNLLTAEHELDARQQLHDKGFVSDTMLKTYADTAAYYRSRLAALKAGQVQEAKIEADQAAEIKQTGARLTSNLDVVRSSLDALTIRAPVAGRLTDFTLEPGQSLKPGDPVGQIDSEGAYKLTADVDEFYLGRVTPGQPATADLDGTTVPLTVSKVLPQVTQGRFRTELTFNGPMPAGLRRGESVDIRITLGDTKPALVLPNGGWLEGGGTYVFVVAPNGKRADRRQIAVGRRNPEQVEITSGLRPGERVVTSSYAGFDKFAHLILH